VSASVSRRAGAPTRSDRSRGLRSLPECSPAGCPSPPRKSPSGHDFEPAAAVRRIGSWRSTGPGPPPHAHKEPPCRAADAPAYHRIAAGLRPYLGRKAPPASAGTEARPYRTTATEHDGPPSVSGEVSSEPWRFLQVEIAVEQRLQQSNPLAA